MPRRLVARAPRDEDQLEKTTDDNGRLTVGADGLVRQNQDDTVVTREKTDKQPLMPPPVPVDVNEVEETVIRTMLRMEEIDEELAMDALLEEHHQDLQERQVKDWVASTMFLQDAGLLSDHLALFTACHCYTTSLRHYMNACTLRARTQREFVSYACKLAQHASPRHVLMRMKAPAHEMRAKVDEMFGAMFEGSERFRDVANSDSNPSTAAYVKYTSLFACLLTFFRKCEAIDGSLRIWGLLLHLGNQELTNECIEFGIDKAEKRIDKLMRDGAFDHPEKHMGSALSFVNDVVDQASKEKNVTPVNDDILNASWKDVESLTEDDELMRMTREQVAAMLGIPPEIAHWVCGPASARPSDETMAPIFDAFIRKLTTGSHKRATAGPGPILSALAIGSASGFAARRIMSHVPLHSTFRFIGTIVLMLVLFVLFVICFSHFGSHLHASGTDAVYELTQEAAIAHLERAGQVFLPNLNAPANYSVTNIVSVEGNEWDMGFFESLQEKSTQLEPTFWNFDRVQVGQYLGANALIAGALNPLGVAYEFVNRLMLLTCTSVLTAGAGLVESILASTSKNGAAAITLIGALGAGAQYFYALNARSELANSRLRFMHTVIPDLLERFANPEGNKTAPSSDKTNPSQKGPRFEDNIMTLLLAMYDQAIREFESIRNSLIPYQIAKSEHSADAAYKNDVIELRNTLASMKLYETDKQNLPDALRRFTENLDKYAKPTPRTAWHTFLSTFLPHNPANLFVTTDTILPIIEQVASKDPSRMSTILSSLQQAFRNEWTSADSALMGVGIAHRAVLQSYGSFKRAMKSVAHMLSAAFMHYCSSASHLALLYGGTYLGMRFGNLHTVLPAYIVDKFGIIAGDDFITLNPEQAIVAFASLQTLYFTFWFRDYALIHGVRRVLASNPIFQHQPLPEWVLKYLPYFPMAVWLFIAFCWDIDFNTALRLTEGGTALLFGMFDALGHAAYDVMSWKETKLQPRMIAKGVLNTLVGRMFDIVAAARDPATYGAAAWNQIVIGDKTVRTRVDEMLKRYEQGIFSMASSPIHLRSLSRTFFSFAMGKYEGGVYHVKVEHIKECQFMDCLFNAGAAYGLDRLTTYSTSTIGYTGLALGPRWIVKTDEKYPTFKTCKPLGSVEFQFDFTEKVRSILTAGNTFKIEQDPGNKKNNEDGKNVTLVPNEMILLCKNLLADLLENLEKQTEKPWARQNVNSVEDATPIYIAVN